MRQNEEPSQERKSTASNKQETMSNKSLAYTQEELKTLAHKFANILSGRKDAWGTLHGGCVKEPLKITHIIDHLSGKESLGSYPLLDDGTCKVAVVDFDFKVEKDRINKAEREAHRFAKKLFELGIKSFWFERSKSGMIHIWLFFSQPVDARKIRRILQFVASSLGLKVANGVLEIFPKQDELTNGQIGNYIHLPYFGVLNGQPLERRVMLDLNTFQPIKLKTFLDLVEKGLISSPELEEVYESLPDEEIAQAKTPNEKLHSEKIVKVLRAYWTEGQRQDLAMYLAGFLAKQRFTWEYSCNLILEVAALCKDEETRQRMAAIKATFEKAQRGEEVKGYKGIAGILKPQDLKVLTNLFVPFRIESDTNYYLTDKEILPMVDFPFEIFPQKFLNFVQRICTAFHIEPEVTAVAILALISGAIGNTVRVSPKLEYEVSPFLWLIIIAPSGYGKSPVMNALIKPIFERQAKAYKRYQSEMAEYKRLVRLSKQDPQIELPEEPTMEHFYLSDTTVEAMANAFETTPRGLIIHQDELAGLILGLNQYKANGKGNDRQHYLELFDGQSWKIDRKSGTKFIPNTGSAIIGGIQPPVLPKVFQADSFEDGLLPRFLLIHVGNKPLKFSRQALDKDDLAYWGDLLSSCYELELELNDNGFVKPKLLILGSKGLELWEAFFNEYGEIIPFLSDRAKVFIPKLLTYSLKFMAILQAIEAFSNGEEVKEVNVVKVLIDEETVARAIKLTRFLAGQAIRTLELYQTSEPKLNEFQKRLVSALNNLQEEVKNGELPLSKIVEEFNKHLPDNLKQTPEKVSSLLRKGLGLETKPSTGNYTVLLWEETKIEELFSKITLTTLTSLTATPMENEELRHAETCNCSQCVGESLPEYL